MKSCANCASVIAAEVKFCPSCGAAQAPPPATRIDPLADQPASTRSNPPGALAFEHGDVGGRAGRPRWPMAVVGALTVAAGVVLGWLFFFGDGGGGAADPESAIREFVDAVNGDDPLLIVQTVAPSEVEGVAGLIERIQAWLDDQSLAPEPSQGSQLDITIELGSTLVVDRADDAALVEVDGAIVIDNIDWPGPLEAVIGDSYELDLADVADRLDERGVRELTIATVREDGGWFVSPMMTAANIGAGLADLSDPDLDRAGEEVDRLADDGSEAVEHAIEAAVGLDFEELATVVAPSVSRLLLVFEDALEDLRDEADAEGYEANRVRVDTRDLDDGQIGVDEVTLTAATFSGVVDIRIRRDCIEIDGGENECVLDSFPGDLDHEQLVLLTRAVDGGHVIDPIPSVADLAGDLIEGLDYRTILDFFGVEAFGEAQQVAIGAEVDIDFDGRDFVVFELDPDPGDRLRLGAFGEFGGAQLFRSSDDGWRRDHWAATTSDDGEPVRMVVWAPMRGCGLVFCERDTTASATAVLHRAHAQQLDGPNVVLTADLDRGDGYVFGFEVATPGQYPFYVEEGDVSLTLRDAQGRSLDDTYLERGRYELEVWNTTGSQVSFRITPGRS